MTLLSSFFLLSSFCHSKPDENYVYEFVSVYVVIHYHTTSSCTSTSGIYWYVNWKAKDQYSSLNKMIVPLQNCSCWKSFCFKKKAKRICNRTLYHWAKEASDMSFLPGSNQWPFETCWHSSAYQNIIIKSKTTLYISTNWLLIKYGTKKGQDMQSFHVARFHYHCRNKY